jgi:4-methylaminobutanoate oxidase (formaldehyde-forming)
VGKQFCIKLDKGEFSGREALLKIKAAGIQQKLVPLTLTPDPLPGGEGVIYGGEAVYADGRVISRVRSGGYGYTIEKNIALCYLPIELAQVGTPVAIDIFGQHVPAVVSQDPLYDPRGERLRC